MSAQEDRFRTEGRAGDPNYVPNVEQKFGQIGDFWNRYTKLADQRDKEMLEDLNSDLDTLLIFAGLFSAVNTAFISISFPLLSPDSSSETNYLLRLLVLRVDNSTLTPENLFPTFSPEPALVQVNCFLLSSLGISLLVAAGAMFGKEWLQNYSRTGKPKPFEEPGRHRQRKYDSAMRWGLAGTVKALLNALLASMVLFILGVAQLLFLKNIVVAICVAVVFGSGIILAIATGIAGAISQDNPYQSVLSQTLRIPGIAISSGYRILKRTLRLVRTSLRGARRHFQFQYRGQFRQWPDIFPSDGASENLSATLKLLEAEDDQTMSSLLGEADSEDVLNARAAHWTLVKTTNLDDQLVVAQNICNLSAKTCYITAKGSNVWIYLLAMTSRALHQWRGHPEDGKNRTTAEHFGVALYHSLMGRSLSSRRWAAIRFVLPPQTFHSHNGSLHALEALVKPFHWGVSLAHVTDTSDFANLDFRLRKAILHRELLSNSGPISLDLMSKFLRHAYDDGVLSMLASYIAADYNNRERTGSVGHAVLGFPTAKWNALLLEAYDGNNLDRNILDALDIGILVFESLDNWDGPAKIYTTFVRTMQSLAIADEAAKLRLTNSLVKLVTKVQWKTPGSVDETRLVGVILRTIKLSAIALDNFQPVETDVSKALWHGLDHIVQLATIRDRAADIDFEEVILDAVDLKSNISGSNSLHAARIEDHPRVVAWLASKLGGFPSETRSWLKLMKKFEIEWFGPNQSLQQVWIDHRFGWRLLGCFRTIKNGDELFLISPVLVKLISFETPKLRQHVIEAGLIPALVDMAIHICKERERFHARWRDGVNLVLEIFYQVWEFSERDRFVTDDKMVAAFKDILPLLESNLRPERDDGKGVHSPLLAGYIHKHRGISAIISHNGDVALNRLYAECDRKVEWGYHLYGEPKTLPCTRTDFASDGMF